MKIVRTILFIEGDMKKRIYFLFIVAFLLLLYGCRGWHSWSVATFDDEPEEKYGYIYAISGGVITDDGTRSSRWCSILGQPHSAISLTHYSKGRERGTFVQGILHTFIEFDEGNETSISTVKVTPGLYALRWENNKCFPVDPNIHIISDVTFVSGEKCFYIKSGMAYYLGHYAFTEFETRGKNFTRLSCQYRILQHSFKKAKEIFKSKYKKLRNIPHKSLVRELESPKRDTGRNTGSSINY